MMTILTRLLVQSCPLPKLEALPHQSLPYLRPSPFPACINEDLISVTTVITHIHYLLHADTEVNITSISGHEEAALESNLRAADDSVHFLYHGALLFQPREKSGATK